MKKVLVPTLCSFLLVGTASAQLTAEQQATINKQTSVSMRAIKLVREAEARAMPQCDATRVVVQIPHLNDTNTESTIETIVTIEWSGACVDGKRDGEGILTWTQTTETNTRINQKINVEHKSVNTRRSEGRFVNGQRLGLWCTTRNLQTTSKTQDFTYPPREFVNSGCAVLAAHDKPLTPEYRKQADGRWQEFFDRSPTDSFLAAGTLEAQSAKVLADAAAGKAIQRTELVVQNRILDELVRGSKIVLAPSSATLGLKDKRVAIVLSSGTISELQRFKRERDALISASSGLTGPAAEQRARFIAASHPDRLLINVAKTLRKYVKTVQAADDLVGLKKGNFDYALILDWKHMTKFDLLGKYASFPVYSEKERGVAPTCESLGGFLVSPDLKAVLELHAHPICHYKGEIENNDFHYMSKLALFFEKEWGKSPDDTGGSMYFLDAVLKSAAPAPSQASIQTGERKP